MLRRGTIDYRRNTFFVTIQAAFNKTLFGAISGERCILNALGRAIEESLKSLGSRYDGVEIDEYVVMPNHVHFIIRMSRPEGGERLGDIIGRFKSWTSKVYRDLAARGLAAGEWATPWQRDYWEKLVATPERLEAFRRYIRENPARWTRDRFGAATQYARGNLELLNERLTAFVASQGASAASLKPRLLWKRDTGVAGLRARLEATSHPGPSEPRQGSGSSAGAEPRQGSGSSAGAEARQGSGSSAGAEARQGSGSSAGAEARQTGRVVISTFTSAQERAVLAKLLAAKRRFVMVCPGGLPEEGAAVAAGAAGAAVAEACGEGRALLVSPVPPGAGVNKQRAVFCNEYILKNAAEVWAGEIAPGRTLYCLLRAAAPRARATGGVA